MSAVVLTQSKSNLEIIREALAGLPDPSDTRPFANLSGHLDAADLRVYKAAYKVIEGMVREGTPRVDAAAIALVRDASNADLSGIISRSPQTERDALDDVLDAMEYAPPSRTRSPQV